MIFHEINVKNSVSRKEICSPDKLQYECVPLTISYHLYFLRIRVSKVWRIQSSGGKV